MNSADNRADFATAVVAGLNRLIEAEVTIFKSSTASRNVSWYAHVATRVLHE